MKIFLSYKSRLQQCGSDLGNVLHRLGIKCKCWNIDGAITGTKSSRIRTVGVSGTFHLVKCLHFVQSSSVAIRPRLELLVREEEKNTGIFLLLTGSYSFTLCRFHSLFLAYPFSFSHYISIYTVWFSFKILSAVWVSTTWVQIGSDLSSYTVHTVIVPWGWLRPVMVLAFTFDFWQ